MLVQWDVQWFLRTLPSHLPPFLHSSLLDVGGRGDGESLEEVGTGLNVLASSLYGTVAPGLFLVWAGQPLPPSPPSWVTTLKQRDQSSINREFRQSALKCHQNLRLSPGCFILFAISFSTPWIYEGSSFLLMVGWMSVPLPMFWAGSQAISLQSEGTPSTLHFLTCHLVRNPPRGLVYSFRTGNALLAWKSVPPQVGPKPYHLFLEPFTSANWIFRQG